MFSSFGILTNRMLFLWFLLTIYLPYHYVLSSTSTSLGIHWYCKSSQCRAGMQKLVVSCTSCSCSVSSKWTDKHLRNQELTYVIFNIMIALHGSLFSSTSTPTPRQSSTNTNLSVPTCTMFLWYEDDTGTCVSSIL